MPKATADENSAALSADLRASALFDVRGKVVVVSGGGSGIGAMLAAALLRRSRRSLVGSAGGGVRSFAVAPTIVKKWCLFYDYVDGVEEKRAPHRADHISLVGDYVGRGEISSGGAFAQSSFGGDSDWSSSRLVISSTSSWRITRASSPSCCRDTLETSAYMAAKSTARSCCDRKSCVAPMFRMRATRSSASARSILHAPTR